MKWPPRTKPISLSGCCPEMVCILGVDGGNTKTIALVAAPDGRILGYARSGCSDIYGASSPKAAVEEIRRAVDSALREAGCQREAITSACFSLAGADWPEDYAYLENALGQIGLGCQIVVYNDAMGALRAGAPEGVGVVIACGTGVATAARNAQGEFWHSSFWQEGLCGLELGRLTLRAVYRSALGIEPPTALTEPVLAMFGQPSVEALLRRFTQRGGSRPTNTQISQIAPLLLNAADAGDTLAVRIVEQHALRLAEYALVAARKVHLGEAFTLVLNGGVFRHPGRLLTDTLTRHIQAHYPAVMLVHSRYEPAIGALLLALEATGTVVTEAVMHEVNQTLPPAELFLT